MPMFLPGVLGWVATLPKNLVNIGLLVLWGCLRCDDVAFYDGKESVSRPGIRSCLRSLGGYCRLTLPYSADASHHADVDGSCGNRRSPRGRYERRLWNFHGRPIRAASPSSGIHLLSAPSSSRCSAHARAGIGNFRIAVLSSCLLIY